MRKSILISLFVALIMFVASAQLWSVVGARYDGDDAAIVSSDAARGAEKKGGGLIGALKAPFRGFKRVYGGGSKETKLRRMTARDAGRFESAGVKRVDDARTRTAGAPPAVTATGSKDAAKQMFEQGRTMLERGNLSDAVTLLSRAVALDPGSTEAHNLLGVAFDRKGLSTAAIDCYRRALRREPNNSNTLNNLGYSLYRGGEYGDAAKQLKRAARYASADPRIWNNLALVQCRMGKYDEALASFKRAGGEFNGHVNLATMLEAMQRDMDAIKHYEAARRLQPDSSIVLQHLAGLYYRVGRTAEADVTRQNLVALAAQTKSTVR